MDERGSGQILLKTRAFGGFEKTQVLAYIDKLREENRQAEEELGAKIASISDARDALAGSVTQFEAQMRSLESQLDEKREKISELTGVIDTLGSEITAHKKNLAARDEEIKAYKETNRRLTFAAEASAEKARRYTEISAQVGEIIIEARRSADDIVSAAREAADSSHKDLIGTARRMADETAGFRQDIADIRATVQQMTEALGGRIDAIEAAASDLEHRLAYVAAGGSEAEHVHSATPTDDLQSETEIDDDQLLVGAPPADVPDYIEVGDEPDMAEAVTGEAPVRPQDRPVGGDRSYGQNPQRRSFFQGGLFRPKG